MFLKEFLTWALVLTVLIAWVAITSVSIRDLYCVQTFGGVWSSIVIDDCEGSYWTPTGSVNSGPMRGGTASAVSVSWQFR